MKFTLACFVLALGTDLVWFSHAGNFDINISRTAPPSTITNPEDAADSGGRLRDSDIAIFLKTVGDLTISPGFSGSGVPNLGDINVYDVNITWVSNSYLVLETTDGNINLIGEGLIEHQPLMPPSPLPVPFGIIIKAVMPGARDGSERRSGQGNTATSRSFAVAAPMVEVENTGDFTHGGAIEAVGDQGTVSVMADNVNVEAGGMVASGGAVNINAANALTIQAGGTVSAPTVSITAQTVTGTVDSPCGTINQGGTVTQLDTVAPVITCPADIVSIGPNVFYTPTATDNCGTVTVSTDIASGSAFPYGTTTVTATATDLAGNSASCSFTVTVANCLPDASFVPCAGENEAVHRWSKLGLCFEQCVRYDGPSLWTLIGFVCGECPAK